MRLPEIRSRWKGIGLTALMVFTVTLVGMNFVPPERALARELDHSYVIGDQQFMREMGILLGPSIREGNHIVALNNGVEIFPAMIDAVRGARSTITFETYIYWSGEIGRQFSEALTERARAGVRVHVLIDWVGSQRMDEALVDTMKDAGVEVVYYRPLRWYHLSRMNNRTHRKLLIVDGRIGFTGGVGIADHWLGDAEDPDHWREMHFRVEGPAVAQMQAVFIDNWIKTSGTVLRGDAYFPEIDPAGMHAAHMFSSSPTGGGEAMQLMYLMAISSAQRTIDLSASYFVPDDITRQAMIEAARRGVRIRVIVPGHHMDVESVGSASRALWGELLQAGIAIHEYQPTMYHCKMLIADGLLVSVGSTNFDNRSFRLNDEANLNVYDAGLAAELTRVFEDDLRESRTVYLETWRNRPLWERLNDRVAGLFSSQL
jgi:cardiolipin synthase